MRSHAGTWLMWTGLAAVIAMNGPLPGAEPNTKDEPTAAGAAATGQGTAKKDRAVGARDPVASAFALPRGVALTAKQQAAYDDLKENNESALRQAFDDAPQAEGATAKAQALREVRECRAKIRAGIQEILTMPYRDATEKGSPQSSGSASEGSRSGGYAPAYGNYGGYYPNGGYYPSNGGYYPYGSYDPYSSSHGTLHGSLGQSGSSTGSSSTSGTPQSTTKPATKSAPKSTAKPASKR